MVLAMVAGLAWSSPGIIGDAQGAAGRGLDHRGVTADAGRRPQGWLPGRCVGCTGPDGRATGAGSSAARSDEAVSRGGQPRDQRRHPGASGWATIKRSRPSGTAFPNAHCVILRDHRQNMDHAHKADLRPDAIALEPCHPFPGGAPPLGASCPGTRSSGRIWPRASRRRASRVDTVHPLPVGRTCSPMPTGPPSILPQAEGCSSAATVRLDRPWPPRLGPSTFFLVARPGDGADLERGGVEAPHAAWCGRLCR